MIQAPGLTCNHLTRSIVAFYELLPTPYIQGLHFRVVSWSYLQTFD
jgi:hypothetical protein